jgi:hypothetical protein
MSPERYTIANLVWESRCIHVIATQPSGMDRKYKIAFARRSARLLVFLDYLPRFPQVLNSQLDDITGV